MVLSSDIFISTSINTYTYGDFHVFCTSLKNTIDQKNFTGSGKVLLLAKKDLQTAFLISGCYVNQIPLVVISEETPIQRVTQLTKDLGISAYFGTSSASYPSLDVPKIEIPDIKNFKIEDHPIVFEEPDSTELFGILMTSGTTSQPKAVPVKYRQLLQASKSSALNLPFGKTDEWLLNLPLHHIGGISVLIRALLSGARVFFSPITTSEELGRILMTRQSLTHASLVPTQLKRLLDNPHFDVGTKFKAILLGGGPISPMLHQRAIERQIPVIPSFGMTETAAQCIAVPFNTWQNVPYGTSGIPLKDIEIDLRPSDDSNGLILWLRGNQIFDGYADSALNDSVFDSEGWFNTGDYARMDANGYVFIEMRREDRIVTGGENVNPILLEELLEIHEDIQEAGVFGLDHEEWGQIVCVALVLNQSNSIISLDAIKAFLKDRVPGFMIPKKLVLVERLPRSKSGKLLRNELKNYTDFNP